MPCISDVTLVAELPILASKKRSTAERIELTNFKHSEVS